MGFTRKLKLITLINSITKSAPFFYSSQRQISLRYRTKFFLFFPRRACWGVVGSGGTVTALGHITRHSLMTPLQTPAPNESRHRQTPAAPLNQTTGRSRQQRRLLSRPDPSEARQRTTADTYHIQYEQLHSYLFWPVVIFRAGRLFVGLLFRMLLWCE